MKPQAVMLKVTPMDKEEHIIGESFKFPAVPIDDLVLLRVPDSTLTSFKDNGILEQIAKATHETGKTFLLLPEDVECLKIEEKWDVVDGSKQD